MTFRTVVRPLGSLATVAALLALLSISPTSAATDASVTLAWDPSPDSTVVGYKIHYGTGSGVYTTFATFGNTTNALIGGLTTGVTYYFAATAYNADGLESDFSNEVSYQPPLQAENLPPTLDQPQNISFLEGGGTQRVYLTGITSGSPQENQVLTVTASSSNPAVVPNPTVEYSSPSTTGSLVFTPAPYAYGTATITVTVSDSQPTANTITRSFVVTINAVNQQPTLDPLGNLALSANAGPQEVALAGITTGAPNENQTITITAISSNPGLIPTPVVQYVSPNFFGKLLFTPVAGASGSATITLIVSDGDSFNGTIIRSFVVTVGPGNQPPTLDPIPDIVVAENSGVTTIGLSGITSGSPQESQTLYVTAFSSDPLIVPHPNVNYVSPSQTGSLSFTPVAKANGKVTITVTVNDGQTGNNLTTRSFLVTVTPVNRPPTIAGVPDMTIQENAPAQMVALSGITSGSASENQTLVVSAISSNPDLIPNPQVSYVSPNTTGLLTFRANPFAFGTAIITVTVNDGQTANNTAAVAFSVTVNPVNQPPTLNPIENIVINENSGQQAVTLTGISSGATNEDQRLIIAATSSNPGLIPNPTVNYTLNSSTATLLFTPAANVFGSAVITVTIDDGGAADNTVTRSFTVTVGSVNRPPTLNPIADLVVPEGSGVQAVNLEGISPGAAYEVQPVTITAISSNPLLIPNPTVKYSNPDTTGVLYFAPVAGSYGTALITVTVSDGQQTDSVRIRTFNITVSPANRPPTLDFIADLTIQENSDAYDVVLSGIGPGASSENQPLTVAAVSSNPDLIPNPKVSYISPNPTAILSLKPVALAFGTAVINVTVNDGQPSNNIVTRSFSVVVSPVNQPPTLDPIGNIAVTENSGTQVLTLSGISSGAANENQALVVTAVSSNPSLISNPKITYASPNSTATLALTPVTNMFGSALITVSVDDGAAADHSTTRSFTVTVGAVNRPPTLNPLPDFAIQENSSDTIVRLAGITSGASFENQPLTVTAISSNPQLIPQPVVTYTSPENSGYITIRPVTGAFGTASITVTVNDGQATDSTLSRTFTVTVNAVNQAPTLNPIADVTIRENDGRQLISISGISSGGANENQPLTITATSGNPDLIPQPKVSYISPNTTGLIDFTPAPNAFGTAVISVTVSDGQEANSTITRSFTVTVQPVNQRPTLDPIANVVVDENSKMYVQTLSGISSGAPNENQPLTITATVSDPKLLQQPTIGYTAGASTATLSFYPVPNASGSATITVTVDDRQATDNLVSRTFTVTVKPANRPPTLDPVADISIPEDSEPYELVLTGIGPGATSENQPLTIVAISSNPELIPDPQLTYISPETQAVLSLQPKPGGVGTAVITITVNDGQPSASTFSQSFNVVVTPVNRAPTLDPIDNIAMNENGGTTALDLFGITSGATNEQQTLTVTAVSSNPALIPNPEIEYTSPDSSGMLYLTPVPNSFGTALITVTVNDGQQTNNVVSRSFVVSVGAVNRPPTLNPIADVIANENAGLQVVTLSGITAGASFEQQQLTVTAVSSNPQVIPNPDVSYSSPSSSGVLTFSPVRGAFGTAVITVTINDGQEQNNLFSRSFKITVNAENRPPTLDAISTVTVVENSPEQTVVLSGITSGASFENQPVRVTAMSGNSALISNPRISYSSPNRTGLLFFTPRAYAFGSTTITVTVDDGQAVNSTFSRQFIVNVTPVNQPPTLDIIANVSLPEDSVSTSIPLTGISAGGLNETQPLTIRAVSSNPAIVPDPQVVYTSPSATGALKVQPIPGAVGAAVITVTVDDGQTADHSVTRSFVVSVSSANYPPTLDAIQDLALQENSAAQRVLLAGISSGRASEFQPLAVSASSSNPNLIPNPSVTYSSPAQDGYLTFTPLAYAYGTAIITVRVSDGQSTNNIVERSFTVTVTPVNQAPTLNPLPNLTLGQNAQQQTLSISGITSGAPNEDQPLLVTVFSSNPSVIPQPAVYYSSPENAGAVSFRPVPFAVGTSTISVQVNDGQTSNNIVTRSFEVTVQKINQAPTLDPIQNVLLAQNAPAQNVALTGITSGSPDETQVLQITATSSNPRVVANPVVNYTSPQGSGSLRIVAVSNAVGVATITVTVDDGDTTNHVFSRSFSVSVAGGGYVQLPNQPPTLGPLANMAILENDAPQRVTLSGITCGSETENQVVTITASSSNPTIIPHPEVSYASPSTSGTLLLKPATNAFGNVTITVTASDGQATNSTTRRTFSVAVTPVNNTPTLNPIADIALSRNAAAQVVNLSGISSGAANEFQALSVSATSDNPQLVPNPVIAYRSPATSGTLTFTPATNATGTTTIRVTVNDGGASNNIVSREFTVAIYAGNTPPTLNPISNLDLPVNAPRQEIQLSGITPGAEPNGHISAISATSSNPGLIPPPTVTFVSPQTTGRLSFTPVPNAAGQAVITVSVDDGEDSNNTTERTFVVTVQQPEMTLFLDDTTVMTGETNSLPLRMSSNLPVTNVVLTLQIAPDAVLTDWNVQRSAPELDGTASRVVQQTSTNVVVRLSALPGQSLQGETLIGQLGFRASANLRSCFATVQAVGATADYANGSSLTNATVQPARVTILGQEPLLEHTRTPQELVIHGRPYGSYAIEYSTDLVHWTRLPNLLPLTTSSGTIKAPADLAPTVFYRAVQFTADPPLLQASVSPASQRSMMIYGLPGMTYTVEVSTNAGPTRVWYPFTNVRLTNSFESVSVPELGGFMLFRLHRN